MVPYSTDCKGTLEYEYTNKFAKAANGLVKDEWER